MKTSYTGSRRVAAIALASGSIGLLASVAVFVPVNAAATPVIARNDTVRVTVGNTVRVHVLANDRITFKKAKATVDLPAGPVPWKDSVAVKANRRQDIVIRTRPTTRPGSYTIGYRVIDAKGRRDRARVAVTIVAKPTVPPTAPGSLTAMVAAMPVAVEERTGYDRDLFRHWNTGLYPDGCDTRGEVLRAEATVPIAAGTPCPYTTTRAGGGQWYSYYDAITTTDPSSFDIDHLVPLAEAWDSGANAWTDTTREAYANDQGDPRALVAVTASANRGKGDQDPGEWQPLLERCRYAAEWVAIKHRWELTVDPTEKTALATLAAAPACTDTTVTVITR